MSTEVNPIAKAIVQQLTRSDAVSEVARRIQGIKHERIEQLMNCSDENAINWVSYFKIDKALSLDTLAEANVSVLANATQLGVLDQSAIDTAINDPRKHSYLRQYLARLLERGQPLGYLSKTAGRIMSLAKRPKPTKGRPAKLSELQKIEIIRCMAYLHVVGGRALYAGERSGSALSAAEIVSNATGYSANLCKKTWIDRAESLAEGQVF